MAFSPFLFSLCTESQSWFFIQTTRLTMVGQDWSPRPYGGQTHEFAIHFRSSFIIRTQKSGFGVPKAFSFAHSHPAMPSILRNQYVCALSVTGDQLWTIYALCLIRTRTYVGLVKAHHSISIGLSLEQQALICSAVVLLEMGVWGEDSFLMRFLDYHWEQNMWAK